MCVNKDGAHKPEASQGDREQILGVLGGLGVALVQLFDQREKPWAAHSSRVIHQQRSKPKKTLRGTRHEPAMHQACGKATKHGGHFGKLASDVVVVSDEVLVGAERKGEAATQERVGDGVAADLPEILGELRIVHENGPHHQVLTGDLVGIERFLGARHKADFTVLPDQAEQHTVDLRSCSASAIAKWATKSKLSF
jgi:hypothetical protein